MVTSCHGWLVPALLVHFFWSADKNWRAALSSVAKSSTIERFGVRCLLAWLLAWQWPDTILWRVNLASCWYQANHNQSLPGTIYKWILLNESLLQVSFASSGITIAIATMSKHTWYLSFFLHGQNFWRKKFTPKNANFSRLICKQRQFFALNL